MVSCEGEERCTRLHGPLLHPSQNNCEIADGGAGPQLHETEATRTGAGRVRLTLTMTEEAGGTGALIPL